MTLFLTKINDDITNIEHRLFQSYRQLKKPERSKYRFKRSCHASNRRYVDSVLYRAMLWSEHKSVEVSCYKEW